MDQDRAREVAERARAILAEANYVSVRVPLSGRASETLIIATHDGAETVLPGVRWVRCMADCAGGRGRGTSGIDIGLLDDTTVHFGAVGTHAVSQGDQMVEHIIQFFAYSHLPEHLQEISRPFCQLADKILELPRNPERTVALRKLLEAKDAAVRAALAKDPARHAAA